MNNPILYYLRKIIHEHRGLTLSFNFRGVGLSKGTFTGGHGEMVDANIVSDHLQSVYPDLPLNYLGYSFGAAVALDLSESSRPERLVLVGFPLTYYFRYPGHTGADRVIILQGEKDEFGTPNQILSAFSVTDIVPEVMCVPASNHFFDNHIQDLVSMFGQSVYGD